MRIVLFYHSLISDWNHGNAHFLRGIVSELMARNHDVVVCEPEKAWSVENLKYERGEAALNDYRSAYPHLSSVRYDPETLNLDNALADTDLVLVHEWNEHALVQQVGAHRAKNAHYRLLFHDTHHRSITDRAGMNAYDLSHYDGVLAFGQVIRDIYIKEKWATRAWTWHEAADTRVFHPIPNKPIEGDLVWIGNWGDDERTRELHEFLLGPVKALHLRARVHGVRYPQEAQKALADAGIDYAGWLPNYQAPEVFSHYRTTVHVPRRPYTEALAGIPTIRVFEALACGMPMVSAPWRDTEGLFTPGKDFLTARDGAEMTQQLKLLLGDPQLAKEVAAHGLKTILERHTCGHRVDQLVEICKEVQAE